MPEKPCLKKKKKKVWFDILPNEVQVKLYFMLPIYKTQRETFAISLHPWLINKAVKTSLRGNQTVVWRRKKKGQLQPIILEAN